MPPAATMEPVSDAIFEDPRLARVYDPLEAERPDLDVYAAIVDELGARTVLDVGCGTGTFACLLAARSIDVVGIDPAAASLDIARAKPNAETVRWFHGTAPSLPPLQVDAAFMTGNVAQVFTTDEAWSATLAAIRRSLRPGGVLVFETRDPARMVWEHWTPDRTFVKVDVPGVGPVEAWSELTTVDGELVTFSSTTAFRDEDVEIESTSTLRFRERADVAASLIDAGFTVDDVRDAPDRPGHEFVFLARRPR